MLLLENIRVVDCNGSRDHQYVLLDDGIIVGVYGERPDDIDCKTIQGEDRLLIPGIVNLHSHGVTNGPLFSSGSYSLGEDKIKKNIERHISQGTTTLVSGDGFTLPSEQVKTHIPVKLSTTHFNECLDSAVMCDGNGLYDTHFEMTVEKMLFSGAIIIGEVGSGATLGGGVQEYKYIPEAVKSLTGVKISETDASRIKDAVLGRYIDPSEYNAIFLEEILLELGIEHDSEDVRRVVERSVLSGFDASIESIREAARLSDRYSIPVMVHHAAPSKRIVEEISYLGRRLIALHSNHPSFERNEALMQAEKLRSKGVVIDVATFDSFNAGKSEEIETFNQFLEHDLVDVVTTDYGGGNHDPILMRLKDVDIDLQQKLSLVTTNPIDLVPGVAPKRGLIEIGYIADLVILDENDIGVAETVLSSGRIVYQRY